MLLTQLFACNKLATGGLPGTWPHRTAYQTKSVFSREVRCRAGMSPTDAVQPCVLMILHQMQHLETRLSGVQGSEVLALAHVGLELCLDRFLFAILASGTIFNSNADHNSNIVRLASFPTFLRISHLDLLRKGPVSSPV